MTYTTITTEGGLLPADILDAIAAEEAPGQQAGDFGLARGMRLSDEIAAAWSDARAYWDAFQRRLQRQRPSDSPTSITRESWVIPLLELLGYRDITYMRSAAAIEGRTYAISHRAGQGDEALPLHIEGLQTNLDARPPTGRPRLSPHALLQEYLNSTEHLWSIVTNGERLRLLRDSSRMTRPSFVEFDLRALLEGEQFNEFALLYRLIHRSRLPADPADAPACWLERYYQQAIEQGGRVREGLRDGVETALKRLGSGFLQHPANKPLREKLAAGTLTPLMYYRQLLRLVYRLLFLMVAEERNLIAALPDEPASPGGNDADAVAEQWLHSAVMTPSGAVLRPSASDAIDIYRAYYSVSRLRRMAEQRGAGRGPYDDLWLGLQTTFRLLEGGDELAARVLSLAPLDGDLFGPNALRDLETMRLRNTDLLGAMRALSLYREPDSKFLRRVNYGALDVEELGSVYESLLDYRPFINDEREMMNDEATHRSSLTVHRPSFSLVVGTERKTTGSYYTRPELVQELIKSALDPVIDAKLQVAEEKQINHKDTKDTKAEQASSYLGDLGAFVVKQKEESLLSITVCDPACGSGHFLLAAARRIGRALAQVRSGEDQPTPTQFRRAVRDVIARCIYGVDLNPLAVDLCKLALWIEGHNAGMPLSFLDSHIRLGNSLIGATGDLVDAGIPDDAFKAVSGDDKKVAAALRKRNKQERELYEQHEMAQEEMFAPTTATPTVDMAAALRDLDQTPDRDVVTIHAKAQRYAELREQARTQFVRYNLWTAAFFQQFIADQPQITSRTLLDHQRAPLPFDHPAALAAHILANTPELQFFHWELEFPQIFQMNHKDTENTKDQKNLGDLGAFVVHHSGAGFDVVLGNPPWERIKLQEQEHFVDVLAIRNARNKAEREKLIKAWRTSDDEAQRSRIAVFDQAKHRAEATSRFVRASGRFPLTAVGDVNTYALFAELDRGLVNAAGRAGIIVPTGIATDDTTKAFFADLNQQHQLVSLYDFENREAIFPGVHRSYKFCLLTLGQTQQPTRLMFFATNVDHLEDERRSFTLTPAEVALINPNTRTSPTFRTQADAELTKKIYRRVPVLVQEGLPQRHRATEGEKQENQDSPHLSDSVVNASGNPWGVRFMAMFHMASDSGLFRNEPGEKRLPLYEAKLLHQFTHRWATYDGSDSRNLTAEELADPHCTITPRYWVERAEVEARLTGRWQREWLLGFRDIARSTDERTAIFSLLPRVGANHKTPLVLLNDAPSILHVACFLAVVNSLAFDYVTRQKLGGTSMSYFILNQLPVLPPSVFSAADIAYIVPRVLELAYTAWDMAPFAADVWQESSEPLRRAICECWKANHQDTKGTEDWSHIEPSCPSCLCGEYQLHPFIWHEERRALLRAELDARIARLYGLTRDELRYILDPADVYGPDFPGETFRVLKEKEFRQYGEYRTRRLVLEAFDTNEER